MGFNLKKENTSTKSGFNLVKNEDTSIPLTTTDGKELGNITFNAYEAIKKNTLDSYMPINAEERKALDNYKNYAIALAQEQEQKELEEYKSKPIFQRYGIDPTNFTKEDFGKWAENHGYEWRMGGNDLTGAEMKWLPKADPNAPWYHFGFSVLPSKQEQEDKEVLETLAENNQRRDASQKDQGAISAAIVNAIDGLTLGSINAYADWDAKRDYKKAGLREEDFVSYKEAGAKTQNEHKIASVAGNIAGSLVTLGGVSKAVSGVTSGIKWLAKAPKWVQSAVNSGITFATISGTETAFDGGNAEDIIRNAGVNLIGGAAGGALSSTVGGIGEKILFDKQLQHKVIPEIIRNGLSSASFAGGKTASTYFLYPEEYRPTAEEMAKDLTVAFAFGAISSAANTMKASVQNKKYLDGLYQKMGADYEKMAKANISGKEDVAGIKKFAKNVIGYSNAMEAYLTGKEYNAVIDGNAYTFTPNKVRLVGQDKYVKTILSELNTIRNSANAVLNGMPNGAESAATSSAPTPAANIAPPVSDSNIVSTDKKTNAVPVVAKPALTGESTQGNVPVNPEITTGQPQETAPLKTNIFTGELDEIAESGSVTRFAPKNASADIQNFENSLIEKGVPDEIRQSIIKKSITLEKSLNNNQKSVGNVVSGVEKLTNTVAKAFENTVGSMKNYWGVYDTNFGMFATPDTLLDKNFVKTYTSAFVESLQANNSTAYTALSEIGEDVSSFLTDYVLTGKAPETVSNINSLSMTADALKSILISAANQTVQARNEVYDENTILSRQVAAISNGNFSAFVNSNITQNGVQSVQNETLTMADGTTVERIGDFYEAFGEEAEALAEKLDLHLTHKTINGEKVPMVGFPAHAFEKYNERLNALTSVNSENMHDVEQNAETTEILTLKHTKSITNLIKSANRIIIGSDCITDGFFAIPKTDEMVKKVKSIDTKAEITENVSMSISQFAKNNNDVIIFGNPKTQDEWLAKNVVRKEYVFSINGKFYACQQKYLDYFNNGSNIIYANKKEQLPWVVRNENGDLAGIIMPVLTKGITAEAFNDLTSVSDVLAEKAEKKDSGFNRNELNIFKKADKLLFCNAEGNRFLTNGFVLISATEDELEYICNEFNAYNDDNYRKAEENDVSKYLSRYAVLPEVGTVTDIKPVSQDKKTVVCIANNTGFLFDKNYANLLKKRSSAIKVLSNGNFRETALIGYDESGNATGFVMPIVHENETIDGIKMFTGKGIQPTKEDVVENDVNSEKPLKKEQKSDIIKKKAALNYENFTLEQTKHTKAGEDLWVIKPKERLPKEQFNELRDKMKELGGYWSAFVQTKTGKGGFVFKENPASLFGEVNAPSEKDTAVSGVAKENKKLPAESLKPAINEEVVETKEKKSLKEDFKVGDIIELDGQRWKCVKQDGLMIDFVNVDKNAFSTNFSHIGTYDSFKKGADYKVVERASENTRNISATNKDTSSNAPLGEPKSKKTPSERIATFVKAQLGLGNKISSDALFKKATQIYGGKMADNVFTAKDAYDAMELGVNQYILSLPEVSAQKMLDILELLPTQTKRTDGMDKFQQFSTPPSIAYLANYAANVNSKDTMLEPSAGIGGIALFAKKDGATVYVNELDDRRLGILKNMPFDKFFNEDAEQINNILGNEIKPSVIVMNPPFSSSSERNIKNTKIGAKHIEQALKILAPNGRLVAIVGNGMADGAPAFRDWWKDIKAEYNVVANIGIDGKNYTKYGTSFDIQMLVIDKNGPTTTTETGKVDTLEELQDKLGGIRDARPEFDYGNEPRTNTATRKEVANGSKRGNQRNNAVSDTSGTADKGKSADMSVSKRGLAGQSVHELNDAGGKVIHNEAESADAVANAGERLGGRKPNGLDGNNGNTSSTIDSVSQQHDVPSGRDRNGGNGGDGRSKKRVPRLKHKELTDSIFEQYQTPPLPFDNVKAHPGKISESAAMSAIEAPKVTYKPHLSNEIVSNGVVSDVQLESVSRAGQCHEQILPNKTRRGYFIGDGTGLGKGRTIAAILLDNYNQGRKKSVWVTINSSLVNDAKRDIKALFGTSDLVTEFEGGKKADNIYSKDEAVLVVSYSTLSRGYDKQDSNLEKITKWLGKDFDGAIVFDEAHKMAKATAVKGARGTSKPSQTALAGIALQEALPKARIVYSSATGATDVENLRYAERLGLWGEGTPFVTGDDFVSKIKAGGLAAMELVARDMKAMGVYLSRNISYEDVTYDRIVHKLTAEQHKIYDELAKSWQIVLQNIEAALKTTNQTNDGDARGRALGAFWGAEQRFFNQILTSMQVPSVIADIEKQLADGKSCVIQLVSTNEAAQNEEFARIKSEELDLEEFDITPKQMLMSFIENGFPVIQYEKYTDDNGNVRSKPVYDSKGNPVLNREAINQREELLSKLGSIKVPSSPLDMIINHFGTDMVAENTGRSRRVINKNGKMIEEKIGNKKDADVDAFQNGKKRIIIFSKAGGTGKSYHADKSAKNQQQRVHYLLEAGWQADNAVQGFGRSHRSNQAVAPIFKLVTTDLKGQMRFISTIAKRLDQLGALTKGQRQTGSQGMFSASDNLENSFAADVLSTFYKDLVKNKVTGISDGIAILEKIGLKSKILDEYGQIVVSAPELREVNKFLNRILSLDSKEQNTVFDGYAERLQTATEKAIQDGTLDKGLENYKADKITLNEVKDIRTDENTGASTKYYNLTAQNKIKPIAFHSPQINTNSPAFVGYYQNKNTGAVRAVFKTTSTTDQYGNVTDNYKLFGQIKAEYMEQMRFMRNWAKLDVAEAEKLWNDEIAKLPEYSKENLHLISGVVLPVWDKLPTENVRIYRVLTDDGEMLIGRVIPEDKIDGTLRMLGSSRTKEKIATSDLIKGIQNGDTVYLENGWKIVQRKVSNENRIELIGPTFITDEVLKKKGIFTERINYQTRYFIPSETNTENIINDVLKISAVDRVDNKKYSLMESEDYDERRSDILRGNMGRGTDEDTGKQAERIRTISGAGTAESLSREERENFVQQLRKAGQIEQKRIWNIQCDFIKPEAYNDDMKSIVEFNKAHGIKTTGFFVGAGRYAFESKVRFGAILIDKDEIYICYNHPNPIYSPQALNKHELTHRDYDTAEIQAIKQQILSSLSESDKQAILKEKRYAEYMEHFRGDTEAVWEEFVCDVLAGVRNVNADVLKLAESYWIENEVSNVFSPSTYTQSTDAGGDDVKFFIDTDMEELTPERKKEIFERFEKDRAGIEKTSAKQAWGERAAWVAHNMTRVFPDIPERGEKGQFYAEFRKMMIQWKALPKTAMFMTQDKLNQMTSNLTPNEFKTFSELVYFLDLQEEAQIQKERGYEEILLPNEISPHEVDQIVDILNKEATDNVKKALEKRQAIWDALKEQYITLNQYIGFDTDGKLKRKNYYHHQVIEYMNNGGKGVAKGSDIEIKAGRGWLKERQGSTKAINTDFLAVEYKAMLQMQYDVYIANMLGKIKEQYDIKPQLEQQAFQSNKDYINQLIRKEASDGNGGIRLDSKGKPDSETYRQQVWYNQRIMFGFSGLFDLADRNALPTFGGEYGAVINSLKHHSLNAPGLYKYVGAVASTELSETATDAQERAQINARTVLKYTSQKREWVKSVLAENYQTWETLAKEMSDTHTIHQPRRGNYFYTKTTIDEDVFNKAFNEMITTLVSGTHNFENMDDVKKLFTQYSDTVRLMGAAFEQWVLPNEIVSTMDKVANPKQTGEGAKAARGIVSAWKGWATSVNPFRTVKFGIRNLVGDLDAVIAGNPRVTLYSKRAVKDIYQAMKHKNYTPEFMEWVERGGYTSMIFANEMDTEMQDKLFAHLQDKSGVNIFKIPAKLFEGYYNGVEAAHNFREAILRYSAYLYYKDAIQKNGGKVKDYVASNRYIVQGLKSVEDKAYQLSKDLLGAYDEVGMMGQTLRRYWVPFYSFTETNLKRYYRMFENIIMSDDKIPKKAGKLLLKGLMVNLLGLIMIAWNRLVQKDNDDELPPSTRNVPHITLGKIGDEVYAFRQLGSFMEILEWFGLEDYKWEEPTEPFKQAFNKAWGMVNPAAKYLTDLPGKRNSYPDVFNQKPIRDRGEYLANSWGVLELYKKATGKPTKGWGEILSSAFVYSYDYKESAYWDVVDIKKKYQGKDDGTTYGVTPKSNALYYMKTAVRYKDKKAALKYLDEYFENGGTGKGIVQSFATLNPMYGYTGKDTMAKGEAFVKSLSKEEKEKLKIAQRYYEKDLMLPENVTELLKRKDITDTEAKNVLRRYINSKCN